MLKVGHDEFYLTINNKFVGKKNICTILHRDNSQLGSDCNNYEYFSFTHHMFEKEYPPLVEQYDLKLECENTRVNT